MSPHALEIKPLFRNDPRSRMLQGEDPRLRLHDNALLHLRRKHDQARNDPALAMAEDQQAIDTASELGSSDRITRL